MIFEILSQFRKHGEKLFFKFKPFETKSVSKWLKNVLNAQRMEWTSEVYHNEKV